MEDSFLFYNFSFTDYSPLDYHYISVDITYKTTFWIEIKSSN